jgi:methanogenic corrinoid protein MtbC1
MVDIGMDFPVEVVLEVAEAVAADLVDLVVVETLVAAEQAEIGKRHTERSFEK